MEQKSETTKKAALAALILLVAGAALFVFWFNSREQKSITAKDQLLVVVEVKGEQIYAVPLSENTTLTASSELGENLILIENGEVSVKEADCPNQICVHHAPIQNAGESIICLPHRMVVSLIPKKAMR